eukprot:582006-Amorphochlora_amoeboformis.AAC.1
MNDPPKKPRRVYTLYTIGYKYDSLFWDLKLGLTWLNMFRNIILSDDDVLNIKENSKLEFVYV